MWSTFKYSIGNNAKRYSENAWVRKKKQKKKTHTIYRAKLSLMGSGQDLFIQSLCLLKFPLFQIAWSLRKREMGHKQACTYLNIFINFLDYILLYLWTILCAEKKVRLYNTIKMHPITSKYIDLWCLCLIAFVVNLINNCLININGWSNHSWHKP